MSAPLARIQVCIQPYDGTGDAADWLRTLEDTAASLRVDSLEKHVPYLLTEAAYAVYEKLPSTDKLCWDKVKKALLAAFSLDCFQAFEQLVARRLGEGESVYAYWADIERLAALVAGEWVKCAFLAGLPEFARAQLRAACDLKDMPMHSVVASARALLRSIPAARDSAEIRLSAGSATSQHSRPVLCFRCGRPDHIRRYCPQRLEYCSAVNNDVTGFADSRFFLGLTAKMCFVCGDTSHLAAACSYRRMLPKN